MTTARDAARETGAPPGHGVLAGALFVVGAASLWATFGLFAKRLYGDGFRPVELASVRAFVAFAVVLPIALATGTRLRVRPGTAVFLVAYGIIGFAVFELVYLAALASLPVSVGAALLYTAPAFVLLIARVTLGERVDAARLRALALVLVGVVLVTGAARAAAGGSGLPLDGVLMGLAAGFAYAVYTVLSKAAVARAAPLVALTWSFGAAALALWPFASPVEVLGRGTSVVWLVGLGIVPTLLAYALFLRALRVLRASAASMIASVEPVVAALLAVLLLGERLHPEQVLGILCVVAAAILTERRAAARTVS